MRAPAQLAVRGPGIVVWPLAIAAGVLLVRAAGAVLPPSLALVPAMALVLGLPGWAILRATRLDERLGGAGTAAVLAPAGLAVWSPLLAAALVIHVSLNVLIAVVLALSAALLAWRAEPRVPSVSRADLWLAAGAAAVALLSSRWEGTLVGDGLFHAGRVRKLVELPELSLSGVSSFAGGAPHAGYVLPLLHAVEAAAISLCGIEPSDSYVSLVPACALLSVLSVFGAGALLGGRLLATVAVAFAVWDAFTRGGGVIGGVEQPSGFAFLVLLPAAIATITAWARRPGDRRLQLAVVSTCAVIAIVHATYAIIPLAFLVAAVIAIRAGWVTLIAAAAAVGGIYALIWVAALRGGIHQPGRLLSSDDFLLVGSHPLAMRGQWLVHDRVWVAAGLFALVPLLAGRRHAFAAALCAGGLALVAFPGVVMIPEALFGAGQTRRLWAGIPWPFVAAAALIELEGRLGHSRGRLATAAAALAAVAIVFTHAGLDLLELTAITSGVAVAAVLLVCKRWGRSTPAEIGVRSGRPWSVLVLLTALLAGLATDAGDTVADTTVHGPPAPTDISPRLPQPLIEFFRRHDGAPFPVVLAEPYAAYELVGEASVYAVALPEVRTRAEPRNQNNTRRLAVGIFFSPAARDVYRRGVVRRYDVRYVLINRSTAPRSGPALASDPDLHEVFRVGSWTVYQT
jgi:hypothetical protein